MKKETLTTKENYQFFDDDFFAIISVNSNRDKIEYLHEIFITNEQYDFDDYKEFSGSINRFIDFLIGNDLQAELVQIGNENEGDKLTIKEYSTISYR